MVDVDADRAAVAAGGARRSHDRRLVVGAGLLPLAGAVIETAGATVSMVKVTGMEVVFTPALLVAMASAS